MSALTPKHGRTVDSELLSLLEELARYLISAGVTLPQFEDMARIAFFRAASRDSKFRNDRLNQSAVAIKTGLTRAQVRQLANQASPERPVTKSRLSNLIAGWSTDAAFSGKTDIPSRLRLGRGTGTFGALVRRYGGDVPARSMLRELQRHNYVTIRGHYVYLRPSVRRTYNEVRLKRLAEAVTKLIGVEPGPNRAPANLYSFGSEVTFPGTSQKGRLILHRHVASSIEALMERMRAAGAAAALDSPPRASDRNKVSRARILFLTEDTDV